MNKNAILIILLLLSVAANIFLYLNKESSTDQKVEEEYIMEGDQRTGVPLKIEQKEYIMHEMRVYMEGVAMIHQGILENKPELLRKASDQSGRKTPPPQDIKEALPKGFLGMGMETRKLFDAIADSADARLYPELAHQQLNLLMNQCSACHSAYRIDVE